MKTIKELIVHLNEHKDAVIILGSNAIKELDLYVPSIEELEENYTKKALRRSPANFWKFFKEKIYVDPKTEMTTTQENVKTLCDMGLVSKVFIQSTDGLLSFNGVKETVNLHGTSLTATCQKRDCKTQFTDDYYMSLEMVIPTCELCGTNLRPDVTILGENYDEDIFMDLKNSLVASHSLILIDIDVKEEAILNLVADYGDIKALDKEVGDKGGKATERVIVAIHKPDQELDFNDITFCEFLVKDECASATNRLLKAIRG